MSDMVGNPEDWFFRVTAHIVYIYIANPLKFSESKKKQMQLVQTIVALTEETKK